MSRSSRGQIPGEGERAVALQYSPGNGAPVIVASGMGHLAEKIVEVAVESGVPVYEDNSLATVLSQMELGREIPEELYQAIVEIYVYFLNFDPKDPEKFRRERNKQTGPAARRGKRHETSIFDDRQPREPRGPRNI